MSQFNAHLENILKKESKFVDKNGALIKNEIINHAISLDKNLIELLLFDKLIKEKFFTKIKDCWIFEINKFLEYIQDKNILSDSYTKFENKISLKSGEKFIKNSGEVSLVWPFKDCILEAGMTNEDQKKDEIFFNEILAEDEITTLKEPKVLTNFKRYTKDGEEKVKNLKIENGELKENLIVNGNNLLALFSLKEQFEGKIKLIYIDPPYNTGGGSETFTYNNNFNHSTWLTFMKNRLEIAKGFLRDDGFIAITIDHCELFYLGVLADELFGRDNRVGIVSIVIRPQGRQFSKFFSATTEYMVVYAKDKNKANFNGVVLEEEKIKEYNLEDEKGMFKYEPFMYSRFVEEKLKNGKEKYFYPIYVSKDLKLITLESRKDYFKILPVNNKRDICWKVQKDKFAELLKSGENEYEAIYDKNGELQIYEKYRLDDGTKIKTHWVGKRYNATTSGTGVLKELLGKKIFSYPKSLYSVLDTLKIMTSKDDIILDFFAGSGTTGHATLELNKEDGGDRKFILIEQLEAHIKVCNERLIKVIKNLEKEKTLNNFNKNVYFTCCELMKYNEEAIDLTQLAKSSPSLLDIWEKLCDRYFLNFDTEIKKFNENIEEFKKLSLAEQKKLLVSMLNKNQLYVNISEINDSKYKVSKEDKELNKQFYKK